MDTCIIGIGAPIGIGVLTGTPQESFWIVKRILSATPLFLFTCKNLSIIFYSEDAEMKENTVN